MKNSYKILLLALALGALTISCKKDKNGEIVPEPHQPHVPTPPAAVDTLSYEVRPEELLDYYIIEVYRPKPGSEHVVGDKDMIIAVSLQKDQSTGVFFSAHNSYANHERYNDALTYDSTTKITTLTTNFNSYELQKPDQETIVLGSSTPDMSYYLILTEHYTSVYRQLIKGSNPETYYGYLKYKSLDEESNIHFGFFDNHYMRRFTYGYSELSNAEIAGSKWEYSKYSDFTWYGVSDEMRAKGYDFLVIPKGNGWKGEHVDKDLLIMIRLQSRYKPVFEPQMYYLVE